MTFLGVLILLVNFTLLFNPKKQKRKLQSGCSLVARQCSEKEISTAREEMRSSAVNRH
jgi:hypothetical protein